MSSPAEGTTLYDPDRTRDAEKRAAIVKLRECYVQARDLGSSVEAHANLEWILGARRNPIQDPLGFETKTIELIVLWLQDLAGELDRPAPGPVAFESRESVVHEASRSLAYNLRNATKRFRAAFTRPV